MFIYVCDRVLDHNVDEIHEQEVGRRVFGRPADYDTSADNTVRVHASMLRKRVDQYFATEGCAEPIVIEIPRGNYAPVFRERPAKPVLLEVAPPLEEIHRPSEIAATNPPRWPVLLSAGLAVLFAALSVFLYLQLRHLQKASVLASAPTVKQFWSQVFQSNRQTDVVLGDAALALFEERTGQTIALSEYFDRSYLNKAGDKATAAQMDADLAKVLLLKKQTNYSDVALLAQMTEIAHAEQSETKIRFAREYSFREIKADNAVLLGNVVSNPWVEPFQNHQALHWKYDPTRGSYYPVDSTAGTDPEKYHTAAQPGQPVEGYAILSLLPNMGGTGTVLIISGTGGTAMNGALSFLSDEHVMSQLHAQLNGGATAAPFPYFEALLRIGSRNTLPRDSSVLIVRRLRQLYWRTVTGCSLNLCFDIHGKVRSARIVDAAHQLQRSKSVLCCHQRLRPGLAPPGKIQKLALERQHRNRHRVGRARRNLAHDRSVVARIILHIPRRQLVPGNDRASLRAVDLDPLGISGPQCSRRLNHPCRSAAKPQQRIQYIL